MEICVKNIHDCCAANKGLENVDNQTMGDRYRALQFQSPKFEKIKQDDSF